MLAYAAYEEVVASDRWKQLADAGANPQRPLWASTGVKNPDYPDTLYVTDLVVADTVNTMPEKTLDAFADHGEVEGDRVTGKADEAQAVFDQLDAVGIDLDDVFVVLEDGGRRQVQEVLGRAGRDRQGARWSRPASDRRRPSTPRRRRRGRRLGDLADGFAPDLRAWFAEDPGRVERP